jgi:membrane associated rhomboid family serine protease
MSKQISKGLKITLLVYAIYSIVYGLLHIISPETVGAKDPAIERVLGAAVFVFALGAGFAYLEREWNKVKISVFMQAAWMILYTITMVWGLLTKDIISMAWAPAIIGVVFALLFTIFYISEEKRNK